MNDIPWDRITMVIIALAIIFAVTQLAAWNIAPWEDVYTIFLIILAGIGFLTSGYYAGEAKAYRRIFESLGPELTATAIAKTLKEKR